MRAFNGHTLVSTHSRLKAAGKERLKTITGIGVSTHSRLKAAGTGQDFDNSRYE